MRQKNYKDHYFIENFGNRICSAIKILKFLMFCKEFSNDDNYFIENLENHVDFTSLILK